MVIFMIISVFDCLPHSTDSPNSRDSPFKRDFSLKNERYCKGTDKLKFDKRWNNVGVATVITRFHVPRRCVSLDYIVP